jgi:hypothetical protein
MAKNSVHFIKKERIRMTSHGIRYLNFLYLFALAKLSDRQTSIMMARFVAGESYRDIARDQGITYQACQESVMWSCKKLLHSPKIRKIILSLKN